MNVTATSIASARGGNVKGYDVMILIDTTQSMNTLDTNCSIAGATRLTCAEAGAQQLIAQLDGTVDHVGVMVFPGFINAAQAADDTDCSSSTKPLIAKYSATPVYQVVALTGGFTQTGAKGGRPSAGCSPASSTPPRPWSRRSAAVGRG